MLLLIQTCGDIGSFSLDATGSFPKMVGVMKQVALLCPISPCLWRCLIAVSLRRTFHCRGKICTLSLTLSLQNAACDEWNFLSELCRISDAPFSTLTLQEKHNSNSEFIISAWCLINEKVVTLFTPCTQRRYLLFPLVINLFIMYV